MTGEREIHEREQMKDSGSVFIAVSKTAKGFVVKVESIGLPSFITTLTKLKGKLQDVVSEELNKNQNLINDIDRSKKKLERKIGNIIFQEIEKEPIVRILFTFIK
jgi:mRNA degradation ribonuclease J1/J2